MVKRSTRKFDISALQAKKLTRLISQCFLSRLEHTWWWRLRRAIQQNQVQIDSSSSFIGRVFNGLEVYLLGVIYLLRRLLDCVLTGVHGNHVSFSYVCLGLSLHLLTSGEHSQIDLFHSLLLSFFFNLIPRSDHHPKLALRSARLLRAQSPLKLLERLIKFCNLDSVTIIDCHSHGYGFLKSGISLVGTSGVHD